MNAVIIIILALLVALVIFALIRMRELDERIDDIYNKVFIMQGGIEDNKARLDAHYTDMAHLNSDIEKVSKRVLEEKTKKEPSENKRESFALFRKQGMDVKSAGVAVGVSYSTAKRYEKWYKSNKAR